MVLAGVFTKKDYYEKRCLPYYKRLIFLEGKKFPQFVQNLIKKRIEWSERRIAYLQHPSIINAWHLMMKIKTNVLTTGFELLIPVLSDRQFEKILKRIKS